MKSYQYRNLDISENKEYSSLATVKFMFLVNDKLIWRDTTVTQALKLSFMVHMMHVHFMFFVVFKNLKSSFLEDNMPGHALDIFIENTTKMV